MDRWSGEQVMGARARGGPTSGESPSPVTIGTHRVAGNIGAVVTGIDVGGAVSDEDVNAIRRAILEHKVVFLRDQSLTYDRQVTFGQRLGELTPGHPIYGAPEDKPFLREFDSRHGTRANHWHTDLTFLDRPPALAVLHAVVVPPVGGDTMWANAVTAYETLSPDLQAVADRIRIVHSNDSDYTDATVTGRRDYLAKMFEADHPAVHVHPETGERSLLLGGFARRVVGLPPQASRDLLRVLQDHATVPEHTVRWQWRPGDLALWDNRSTQHYAILDYGEAHRRCERVTVAGGRLVGVDGRPSSSVTDDYGVAARETQAFAPAARAEVALVEAEPRRDVVRIDVLESGARALSNREGSAASGDQCGRA
jgi:alpha-ketoglutarate-dependent taurine dioxygenase